MEMYLVIRQKENTHTSGEKLFDYQTRDIVAVCDNYDIAIKMNRRSFNNTYARIQKEWCGDSDHYGYEDYGNGELFVLNEYFYLSRGTSITTWRHSVIKVNTNELLLEA